MIRKSLNTDEVEFFIIGDVIYIGKLSGRGCKALQEELRKGGRGAVTQCASNRQGESSGQFGSSHKDKSESSCYVPA